MTCDERRDSILLYASGCLDAADRAAVCEHLATGCPICSATLIDAQKVIGELAAHVEPVAPPATAMPRLLSRVKGVNADAATRALKETTGDSLPIRQANVPSASRLLLWVALTAAACIAITAGSVLYWTRDARSFWRAQDLVAIRLASPTQPEASGQLLWDRTHARARIVVDHAITPKAGREYEVWIIPPGGAPVRSQTFKVDAQGDATIVIPVPTGTVEASTFAITDEPLGGVDAPTGSIHFAGTLTPAP